MKRKIAAVPLLLIPLLVFFACHEPTAPSADGEALPSAQLAPPGVTAMLWGSSSESLVNPASLFTIDPATGTATPVGATGITEGSDRLRAIDFDPNTGRLYGIKGGPCYGAILITLDPTTGAGTIVDTLMGPWFDGTPGPNCPGGSAAIAFAPDGTLYASGWYGGIPQGKIMKVDKQTGTVLEVHPTPLGYDDWRGRRVHLNGLAFDANGTLWASRGNSVWVPQLNTVDPNTGEILSTLVLNDPVMEDSLTIADLAFGTDGVLYASLPWESMLATIDTSTGDVTRIGPFGPEVVQIAGLTVLPRTTQTLLGRYWFNEAESGQGPTTVYDDQAVPVNLSIEYTPELAWTLQDGNRGLRSSAFNHDGIVRGEARNTKYDAALDRASQATFVVVAAWVNPFLLQGIAGFQSAHKFFPRPVAWFETDAGGVPSMMFRTRTQTTIRVSWPPGLGDNVRRVFHIVYDSNDPVAERRIRLYVNGIDQGPGQLDIGDWPRLGEELDFNMNRLELQMMNWITVVGPFALRGTVFYYAVYETALGDLEISGNASALLADDDDLP